MNATRFLAAMVLGTAICAAQANAQSCSGNAGTCNLTNTASVTVGALVKLGMSSAATTLTSPSADQVDAGTTMLIGGPTSVPGTGAGNVFAGNTQYGNLFNGGTGTSVSGNIIGLSPFGNVLPNSTGIFGHSANDVQVGSALDSLSRNVISGNQLGIQLLDVKATALVQPSVEPLRCPMEPTVF